MKKEAILHIPMSAYAYGIAEDRIVYRLRCAKGDLIRCTLYYGDTACRVTPIDFFAETMEIVASDEFHDYWEVEVKSRFHRVYYYFELTDGVETCLYYGDIFTDTKVEDRSQYFKIPINHRADIAKVPDWTEDAIVYNIFPDSFATGQRFISGQPMQKEYEGRTVKGKLGGTLAGITENIAYLKELGINCVYLNPIFAAGEYHKYDLLDYFHVDPCFGGDEAFREMIKCLHENNMRVIIDGVFNHCGWHFFAFEDVLANQEKSRYRDWFYRLSFPVKIPDNPEEYPGYECFAYERMMPKLNTANPEVREYFCKVGQYWVKEFGIDGWRLDVASEVDDGFWRAFRHAVKEVNPDTLLIGEVWETASHWLLGDMFDSTMNYDLRKHANCFFAEESIDAAGFSDRITNMLMRYKKQMLPAQMNLLDSHDVSRFLSLCQGDIRRYRLAVLFLMTFIGMPTLFYGDEQGILGLTEEEYRQPMPWNMEQKELFSYICKLIALRKELKPLRKGNFRMIQAKKGSRFLCYSRNYEAESVVICMNCGVNSVKLPEISGECYMAEGKEENYLKGYGFAVFSVI